MRLGIFLLYQVIWLKKTDLFRVSYARVGLLFLIFSYVFFKYNIILFYFLFLLFLSFLFLLTLAGDQWKPPTPWEPWTAGCRVGAAWCPCCAFCEWGKGIQRVNMTGMLDDAGCVVMLWCHCSAPGKSKCCSRRRGRKLIASLQMLRRYRPCFGSRHGGVACIRMSCASMSAGGGIRKCGDGTGCGFLRAVQGESRFSSRVLVREREEISVEWEKMFIERV